MTWVWIALAGGLGAWSRFRLDAWIRGRVPASVPLGTLVINVVGSFALGALSGWASHHRGDHLMAIVGTGLLGGFTTFSTATLEWVNLTEADRRRPAWILLAVMVAGGLAAAMLGLVLGSSLP